MFKSEVLGTHLDRVVRTHGPPSRQSACQIRWDIMSSSVVRARLKPRLKSASLEAVILVERVLGALVVALSRRGRIAQNEGYRLLVAGPGNGSIGDEAMYEAFVRASPDPVLVVARSEADLLALPSSVGADALYMPGLLYGGVVDHLRALWRFTRAARGALSVSVVGADTMDGRYNVRPSVRRFRVAAVGARLGIPSCVLGFSWNEAPHPATRKALRQTPAGVTLFGRDPVSVDRLRLDGGRSVVEAADLAFLVEPQPALAAIADWLSRRGPQRVVMVNANPRLINRFPDLSEATEQLVDSLIAAGYACLVLPHDSRGGAESEVAYLHQLFATEKHGDSLHVAPHVFLPPQVAWIASQTDLVVSGRMHLVILAAVGGTPALGMDYQGKFEGLYQHFGYDLRIEAGVLDGRLTPRVLDALERRDDLRATLAASMPQIRALAQRNLHPQIRAAERAAMP